MSGIELVNVLEPRLDKLSQKVQEIRERRAEDIEVTMDGAMDVLDHTVGRNEAAEAGATMQSLAQSIAEEGLSAHGLNAGRVADLIADPFEDM